MARSWRFRPYDESRVRQLCRELSVAPLTAQVLLARGFEDGPQARGFLDSRLADLIEPERLPGVPEATDRLVAAVRAGRRITIYGDYDVDGVTATSILWHCLRLAGAEVDYYIPHRMEEGYGLNCEALRQLHADRPDRLVVSVDCGITSLAEAALAREIGLELVVTDHHRFEPGGRLPEAACIVHPRLPGTDYPFGDLCGAGVAFKLAWAVCKRLGDGKNASPRMRDFLKSAVGLAAIGTVADVVPLLGENRVLVRYGLSTLKDLSSLGLRALATVAQLDKKPELHSEDIAFSIAPRINAAGRLGQARLAVELLVTDDVRRAVELAAYLEELNKNRRTVERRILKEAKELVEERPEWDTPGGLVLAHEEWHPGVIGIVANRVAEHFQRPTVLVALSSATGLGQGSGRSFAGRDLHAALVSCAGHLVSFGGHPAAAGLKIEKPRIEAFRLAFSNHFEQGPPAEAGASDLRIDAEVRLADVTSPAVKELDRLGPFGAQNPRPLFVASNVELAEPPRTMGEGDRHLQMRVKQYGRTLRAIAFGRGEWAAEIAQGGGPLSICFEPSLNSFNGRENVELQLRDWQRGDKPRAHEESPGVATPGLPGARV